PVVDAADQAIWDRLLVIPFEVRFRDEDADEELGHKLEAELPGILNWALDGCRQWQQEGLKPPSSVTQAVADYRDESNPLREWADEVCDLSDPTITTPGGELRDLWKPWAEQHNIKVSNRDWPRYLEALGCERIQRGNKVSWRGIKPQNSLT